MSGGLIVAIVGPTASGKTALAVKTALALNGEVISCDSMLVYRRLDIGTAKPSEEERGGIPHHLIDVCEPAESFSCGDYADLAVPVMRDIISRGKTPVFCGGTGLYLEAALMRPAAVRPDIQNHRFREEMSRRDAAELYAELALADPDAAAAIGEHNKVRLIRALEINRFAGLKKAEWDALGRAEMPPSAMVVGLAPPRDVLYGRINERVDAMLAAGLPEEVRALYEAGMLPEGSGGARAIGYKELLPWARGELPLTDAAENLKTATRRYAKRQLTWFRAKPYVSFFESADEALRHILGRAGKLP